MHVMIDLETLSLHTTAAIIELGYALFEPNADGVIWHSGQKFDVAKQLNNGRHVSFSTIQWWMRQNDAARNSVFAADRYPDLNDYLISEFTDNIAWSKIDGIWSHGAAYDIPILTQLFFDMKRDTPWNYRSVRDTRTLYDVVGMQLVDLIQAELKHSAESDAIAQALSVQKAYRLLREKNIT